MTAPIDRHDTQEGVVSTPLGDVLVRIVQQGDAEAYRELRLEALKKATG